MKPTTDIEACYLRLCGVLDPFHTRWQDGGLKQFRDQQSKGALPEDPHPTYELLQRGKAQRDVRVKEIREDYFGQQDRGYWSGLVGLIDDWNPDLWIIPLLIPWHEKAGQLKEVRF
jgi:hypothetical protein